MAKVTPIRMTEQFEHFLEDLKDSFWGDVCGKTRLCLKRWLEQDSLDQRDQYMRQEPGESSEGPSKRYRNGFYERDWVTKFGTIRLRIARTRDKELFADGAAGVPTPGRGGGVTDPRGLSARHQYAPSGPNRSDDYGRTGECTDGIAADSQPG